MYHLLKLRRKGYKLPKWQSHGHALGPPMQKSCQVCNIMKWQCEGHKRIKLQSHGHGLVLPVKTKVAKLQAHQAAFSWVWLSCPINRNIVAVVWSCPFKLIK